MCFESKTAPAERHVIDVQQVNMERKTRPPLRPSDANDLLQPCTSENIISSFFAMQIGLCDHPRRTVCHPPRPICHTVPLGVEVNYPHRFRGRILAEDGHVPRAARGNVHEGASLSGGGFQRRGGFQCVVFDPWRGERSQSRRPSRGDRQGKGQAFPHRSSSHLGVLLASMSPSSRLGACAQISRERNVLPAGVLQVPCAEKRWLAVLLDAVKSAQPLQQFFPNKVAAHHERKCRLKLRIRQEMVGTMTRSFTAVSRGERQHFSKWAPWVYGKKLFRVGCPFVVPVRFAQSLTWVAQYQRKRGNSPLRSAFVRRGSGSTTAKETAPRVRVSSSPTATVQASTWSIYPRPCVVRRSRISIAFLTRADVSRGHQQRRPDRPTRDQCTPSARRGRGGALGQDAGLLPHSTTGEKGSLGFRCCFADFPRSIALKSGTSKMKGLLILFLSARRRLSGRHG